MIATVIPFVTGVFCIAVLLTRYPLPVGPALVDRILALDTLMINSIALIVLADIQMSLGVLFEAALLMALMGFIGTVAMTKYLLRGDVIE